MGGALGLRAARCEPFGRGLSGAAREQPAPVGVGPARSVGGVLWGPRGTRTANGRRVRPLGSGTRLEPSSADRPHLGWPYDRAVVMGRAGASAIPFPFRRQGVLDGRRPGLCTPPTLPPFGGESSIDGTRGTSLWLHKSSSEFRS